MARPLTAEQAAEDAAVAATVSLLNSKEAQAAVRLLAALPRRMLEVSQKIDPVPYPQNTLSGFKLSVVEWLANNSRRRGMSKLDRGRPTLQPDGLTYDPFPFAGAQHEWGRPDIDQGPRGPSEGFFGTGQSRAHVHWAGRKIGAAGLVICVDAGCDPADRRLHRSLGRCAEQSPGDR